MSFVEVKKNVSLVLLGVFLSLLTPISESHADSFERLATAFDKARNRAEREEGWTTKQDVDWSDRARLNAYNGPLSTINHGYGFISNHFGLPKPEFPLPFIIDAGYAELEKVNGDVDKAAHYLLGAYYVAVHNKGTIEKDDFYKKLDFALIKIAKEWEYGVNREVDLFASYIMYQQAAGFTGSQQALLKIEEFHREDIGIPWWVSKDNSNEKMRLWALEQASCGSETSKRSVVEFTVELCKEAEKRKEELTPEKENTFVQSDGNDEIEVPSVACRFHANC